MFFYFAYIQLHFNITTLISELFIGSEMPLSNGSENVKLKLEISVYGPFEFPCTR